MLALSAAGFIATSTLGSSPAVKISLLRKVELEAADTGEGSRGGANLGREIGQSRDIVAGQRRFGGELHPGQLHPVARVAGKANDDVVDLLAPLMSRTAAGKAMRIRGLSGCLRW